MAKKEDRYKLPKYRVGISLVAYTLVFLVMLVLIVVVFELLIGYIASTKAEGETKNAIRYAERYEQAAEEGDIEMVFADCMEDGYEYFISDSTLHVLRSSGDVTAELEWDSEVEEDLKEVMELREADTDAFEMFDNSTLFFADESTNLLRISGQTIAPNILKIVRNENLLTDINHNVKYQIPYWTAFPVKDGSEVIGFKTTFEMSAKDVFFMVLFFSIAVLIATCAFVALVLNIVRLARTSRKMKKVMFHDTVTENQNWLWFVMKSREILRKRKTEVGYAVVNLVFIRYRNYVLCHSVEEGEQMLRRVFETIQKHLDKQEACAHSTSSHFPILLKATDEKQARERLEMIMAELEGLETEHDFKFQAGVYMVPSNVKKEADIDLLYNNASAARMSLGEEESGIAFFDNKIVENEKWIDTVNERQKRAVENEEFQVYYQPKYDPRTNELMGAEALIRWISDDLGFVPPGKFIPIFEDNGFITEIDHYMLAHVARDQKRWLDEGRKVVPVSVNVSRAHFAETDLADQIRKIVSAEGTPHELIEIELTESAFFDDKRVMLATIKRLKAYGFKVSMDDFGSGYSSLNSLKDLPLDILKLDAGFFRGKNDIERTKIVVSEAIHLAKRLNMKTVAEGVEEKEHVAFLADEECDMIQGYYYSKPLPKAEFEERMGMAAVVQSEENPEAPIAAMAPETSEAPVVATETTETPAVESVETPSVDEPIEINESAETQEVAPTEQSAEAETADTPAEDETSAENGQEDITQ